MEKESRFERGYKKLLEIDGKAGQEVENEFKWSYGRINAWERSWKT